MDRATELSRLMSSASAEGSTKLESFTLLEGGCGAAEASGRGLSLSTGSPALRRATRCKKRVRLFWTGVST